MKFSCEKYLLQQAVVIASRCVASKSPMPALEGLLLQAGTDIRITGYDLKKGIYTRFSADVAEQGSIVLNARLFGEIVRNLPDGIVTLETRDGLAVNITCGLSDFSIIGTDSGEYPELPTVDRQNAVTVPQEVLGRMIRQTVFAVSDNESRPVYTGALFDIEGDTLSIVAVDGFRLAIRKERVEKTLEDCSFIVPGAALNDVDKLCSDDEKDVDITVGSKHISFVIGDTVLISRRLEGEFLNYKKSVPTEFAIVVEADKDELTRSVSRVSLVIDERTKSPLHVAIQEGKIVMSCRSALGAGEDTCEVDNVTGGTLSIGINNRYLLDALKAAPADTIRIGFNSESAPCVITAADGGDTFSYMILPVRLRSGS